MSVGEYRFRGAAFGFNRKDVLSYIEAVHKDHAAQLQSLKEDLERERDQRSQMEEQGSLANEEAAAAGKDAQRCKEELEQALKELRQTQSQREDLRLRLQSAQEDLAALQKAADRMAPAAKAYEALKEKAAVIELDAHNRAQLIVKQGEEEAAEIRRRMADWLRQVESSYARLRSDVAATLSNASTQLERTVRSLDGVNAELDAHGQRLTDIMDAGKETPGDADQAK